MNARIARLGLALHLPPTADQVARLRAVGEVAFWDEVVDGLRTERDVADPADELERGSASGLRFLIPGDPEWPVGLAHLDAYTAQPSDRDRHGAGRDLGQPFGLWARGAPLPVGATSVAIVGARAATSYGVGVALELGSGLAERGFDVVSGAAFGIDGAAHRGALAVRGRTVAVLACGVDVAYPDAHEALLAAIATEGTILSEARPGRRPERGSFLRRNRLLAAITGGTVLVEAGMRSGARNTMAHARELGRHRMVVPGPVTSHASAGCHATLREDQDAHLVTGVPEILDLVGRIGEDAVAHVGGPADVRDGLGHRGRELLDLLPAHGAWSLDRLVETMRLDARSVVELLSALTLVGLVDRCADGWTLTALGRRPSARGG